MKHRINSGFIKLFRMIPYQMLPKCVKKYYNGIIEEKWNEGGIRMASVQAVCNTFLLKSFTESDHMSITPMKLQKLIYFAYKDYLQKTGNKAFNDAIQTWKYGPVVQSVYDEFKSFGKNPIKRFARDAQDKVYIVNDKALNDSIDCVWNQYKSYTGIELSKITHEDGTAWSKAFDSHNPYLKDDDIKDERPCC